MAMGKGKRTQVNPDGTGPSTAITITMPETYFARIRGRCKSRGVSSSEAIRQMMDEARNPGAEMVLNKIAGELNQIALAIEGLKLSVQRADTEGQGKIRVAAASLANVRGLLSAITPV